MSWKMMKDSYIISARRVLFVLLFIILCVSVIGILISKENGYKNQVEELKNELLEEKGGEYKERTLNVNFQIINPLWYETNHSRSCAKAILLHFLLRDQWHCGSMKRVN